MMSIQPIAFLPNSCSIIEFFPMSITTTTSTLTQDSSLKGEGGDASTTVEKVTKNKCERCGLPATFACPTCKERGIVTKTTCGNFCSQACFKLEWPTHKLQHVRKAKRGINAESPMKLYISSVTSAEAIQTATLPGTSSEFISSDPNRVYKYWGFMTCKETNYETINTLQFKDAMSAPALCAQTSDDQVEIEFFDERKGHVVPDVANVFVNEEWYETILLPFVCEAPSWQEFVHANCRLFSCTAALYLGVLAMVTQDDGTEEIRGHGGTVNKRGKFKLILRDQNRQVMSRREGMFINADGEEGEGLSPIQTMIEHCWDVCVPFRAHIPKVVLMNPPSLPYRCMTQRTSPQDVEFTFFDREKNRHANEIQSVYLNKSWFNSCIQPHFYTGPTWIEFVSLGNEQSYGACHIMSVNAGFQLGLLTRDASGKATTAAIETQKK